MCFVKVGVTLCKLQVRFQCSCNNIFNIMTTDYLAVHKPVCLRFRLLHSIMNERKVHYYIHERFSYESTHPNNLIKEKHVPLWFIASYFKHISQHSK